MHGIAREFSICLIALAIAMAGRNAHGQPVRLKIMVGDSNWSIPVDRTSAYYESGDKVVQYNPGGTETVIFPLKPNGSIVPVFVDADKTKQLFLAQGDTFNWVDTNGKIYTKPIIFSQYGNPCEGATSLEQMSPCSLPADAIVDSYPYGCPDCSDPRIVVHPGTVSLLDAKRAAEREQLLIQALIATNNQVLSAANQKKYPLHQIHRLPKICYSRRLSPVVRSYFDLIGSEAEATKNYINCVLDALSTGAEK